MRRLLVVVALLSLCHATLAATVLLPIEFKQLVAISATIVRGRIIDVRAGWADGRRAIETRLTIEADEYLKGQLGGTLTVRVPGGQIGRYRTIVIGAPEFRDGDEVVLFLRRDGDQLSIVGLSQGAYRVQTDAAGRRLVTSPVVMAQPGVDRQAVVRGDVARRPLAVESFRDLVKRVVAGDAK
jgi:hypothetical protein